MRIENMQTGSMYQYNAYKKDSFPSEYGNVVSNMKNVSGTKSNYVVYEKTDDTLYSGGNGTGLSFYIKYADEYTRDNPVFIAKGVDENGREFEEKINVNEVNPQNATLVEMRALEAYLDIEKMGDFSSLPLAIENMGLNDRTNFNDMFKELINQQKVLGQRKAAAYYEYSMQEYWKFFNAKSKGNRC